MLAQQQILPVKWEEDYQGARRNVMDMFRILTVVMVKVYRCRRLSECTLQTCATYYMLIKTVKYYKQSHRQKIRAEGNFATYVMDYGLMCFFVVGFYEDFRNYILQRGHTDGH